MTRGQALLLRAFAVWTVYVWVTRMWNIWRDDEREIGFKVVHTVLAGVSIAFAGAAWIVVQRVRAKQVAAEAAAAAGRRPSSRRPLVVGRLGPPAPALEGEEVGAAGRTTWKRARRRRAAASTSARRPPTVRPSPPPRAPAPADATPAGGAEISPGRHHHQPVVVVDQGRRQRGGVDHGRGRRGDRPGQGPPSAPPAADPPRWRRPPAPG